MTAIPSPFKLPRKTPFGIGEKVIEKVSGLSRLNTIYQSQPFSREPFTFVEEVLEQLNTDYSLNGGSLEDIPQTGPLVVVANHPLGGLEGVILANLIGKVRRDIKVLANEVLARIPQLTDLFIGVDVFETRSSRVKNARAIKEAHRHLSGGGVLIVFPAGEVSSWQSAHGQITDKDWSKSIGSFVRHSQASVMPVFIGGMNSRMFYQAGRVHPILRTLLLPRELTNKSGITTSVFMGDVIHAKELTKLASDKCIADYLRLNTYLLNARGTDESLQDKNKANKAFYATPVIPPIDKTQLADEVEGLDTSDLLLKQGDYEVYCVSSHRIPLLLSEIGRVREISFREVGEGSGKACDVDEYDASYLQLFVWQKHKHEVVGAYRLGITTHLTGQKGIEGLYSRSLFSYDSAFVKSMGNSIEVGRSVVAPAYQRHLQPLLMLWKGIAHYVAKHPEYTHLFGPVSISNDYSPIARQLIASVMSVSHYDNEKAKLVQPTTPLAPPKNMFWRSDMLSSLGDVSLFSKVLSRLEKGPGIPILLKQYLGLNGKLVCFNVDPAFNNALDGLIVVNLTQVNPRTLGKYMGKEGAQQYLQHHQQQNGR
ncbi:GNAT family N-acyltransferase [Alteromonas sp. C1M14]|uniref:lysophospholipid acyltransferase family protein n=1 Tax=Alteromonas sp. C1M14 TaxID=2841567 RepID=UPI001C0871D7|nr:GNAT family N-acyltransferase [Alteromonas sp. C1M14]MBU2976844.1 lysophospholipid acyltransferase family protein [Alteromonas sp. C1M14]